MSAPTPGISLPVQLVRVSDGDTVVVRLGNSAYEWRVRLIGVWAAELNTIKGIEARAWLQNKMWASEHELLLHVPLPRNPVNLLANLSFDRIPGYIWAGEENLNEAIVAAGHATKTKAKK